MSSTTKLKVLVTIPSAFCFGLQHITLDLFDASRQWIDPYFVVTKWNDGDFEKRVKALGFPFGFTWLGMFSRKLDWINIKMSFHALIKLPKLYFDFFRLFRRINPDVLFFANHHELVLLTPVLLFSKRPVVCHMHDVSPPLTFQKINFLWYGWRVHKFIAISYDAKDKLIALGCAKEKIFVVHNGIQLPPKIESISSERFRNEFFWPPNSFVIGITGQMAPTKGHEDLIEAFSDALKANSKLRLAIGGKRKEPFFSQLRSQIKEKGLEDFVGFCDWMENARDFYQAIDLLVLASRHDEGYGLVVAEAMAYSKPVVITRSGGAVEIVQDGVTGFIVEKNDKDAMSRKIVDIAADKIMQKQFGDNAYRRIEKKFSIEIAAKKISLALMDSRK